MRSAELVLALLALVAALVSIAQRLGIAYPILLVLGGLVLGAVPGIPRIVVPPDVVFAVVLPPIVYITSFFTPLRTLKANRSAVAQLAVGLVIASALIAAVIAHALIPGMTWPIALLLGAIASPTDEVAITQVAARFSVPRRVMSILDGEALLNDATALTIYRVALVAALAGTFSIATTLGTFVYSTVGGVVVGFAVAWILAPIRAGARGDTSIGITLALLTPYAAFLAAEALNTSGVISCVVAGLYLGSRLSRISDADVRLAGRAVWEMVVFLLNGFVFILTGLEVPYVLRGVAPSDLGALVAVGVAVTAGLIAVRVLWVIAMAYGPIVWRRKKPPKRLLGEAVVLSWAGLRGVVSVAVLLALPTNIGSRPELLVVVLTVIMITLVGQGLTLPWVIRRAHLGVDTEVREEVVEARGRLNDAAIKRIDELYSVWPTHHPLLNELRERYRHRSEHVERQRDGTTAEADRDLIEHREIRRNVAEAEREALLRLRTAGDIDDDVLRKIERELDLEEQRGEA